MCFSISYALKPEQLEERFNAKFESPGIFKQAYHVSAFSLPAVPVITDEKHQIIQQLKWGLIPFWVKDEKTAKSIRMNTFNARAETIFEKPSFKHSIMNKRCIVLADGFFEWREVEVKKIPYYIRLTDHRAFAIAGIWDSWHNKAKDEGHHTFALITTQANPLLERIHNTKKRMPVILEPEAEERWLSDGLSKEEINSLMAAYDDSKMEAYTVSKLVSQRGKNTNIPEVIEKFDYEELKIEQSTLF